MCGNILTTWGFPAELDASIWLKNDDEKEEEEEGWKTCRSSDFCSPDSSSLNKPLCESPNIHSASSSNTE